MPRPLSKDTIFILMWLWQLPWACAADIARITGLKSNAVSNVLYRRRQSGWLEVARIGRTQSAMDRYVFSTAGVKVMHERYGWDIFWFHSATAIKALARRLEVVEMAYLYLPQLWQSNLVDSSSCWVYRERADTNSRTGEPIMRVELEEADWSRGEMVYFHWIDKGPFEAVVCYRDGCGSDDLLRLPVLWRGNFQKPSELASVQREMEQVLRRDKLWEELPTSQAVFHGHGPGMVIFTPDRVSAAMSQRNWREALNRDNVTHAAIIDAQGQVVRAMSPPADWWEDFSLPRSHLPPHDVGDVSRAVRTLMSRAYTAVNGEQAWRIFRAVDGSPGVNVEQVEDLARVDTGVAKPLLDEMVEEKAKVLAVKGRGKGYYLDASGRALLADSQRVTRARTNRRWGVYAEKDGVYRRLQADHNRGQADAIRALRQHGFAAYPTMGVVIEYWRDGRRIRVTPDAFVVLPPGVLVAVEFERSATSETEVEKKAKKYGNLERIGYPIPVLFITETAEAAEALARLRCPFLLATTLDAVREGPHGYAVIENGITKGDPGCWWYWYNNREAPTPDAPIDLQSHLYTMSDKNLVWRLPLDSPFRQV